MPSFDVVSRVDMHEVDNAVNGVRRETQQRFDLKGTRCGIDRNTDVLTITADDNMKLNQMHELLHAYLARRKVDSRALDFKPPEAASGGSLRQTVLVRQGVDAELGRKIIKALKATKIKVQLAHQGDELRVSGKKRDDLQETIAFIKGMEIDQPLQYVNYRD